MSSHYHHTLLGISSPRIPEILGKITVFITGEYKLLLETENVFSDLIKKKKKKKREKEIKPMCRLSLLCAEIAQGSVCTLSASSDSECLFF